MTALIRIKQLESRIKLLIPLSRSVKLVLFLILTALFLPQNAFAQTPIPATPLQSAAYSLPPVVSPTSPLYTDLLVSNMFHTFSCLAIGQSLIGQPCLAYQMTKNAQGTIQSLPMLSQVNLSGGALGTVSSLIGALYMNPPVRTADYLASVGHGLGIVKEAHAQGVVGSGQAVLSPILSLWQVSRNISYVIMIIIFIVIGLMIMFRQRINPQTVITAQAALPGLVIGLILITFSYFLAGLLVDTAFIGTNIVGAYFSAAQQPPPAATNDCDPNNLAVCIKDKNVLSIMSTFVGKIGIGDLHGAVSEIINHLGLEAGIIIRSFASFLAYQYTYQFAPIPATTVAGVHCLGLSGAAAVHPGAEATGITQVVLALTSDCMRNDILILRILAAIAASTGAGFFPATAITVGLYVILIAVLLYTMFKLLLRLVNCFISIIFYTITAPFHFLAASLPGRQSITTGWILNMLCNVLAFPAVIGVFYFVNYLFGSGPFPVTGTGLDLTGQGTLPLFGGMGTNFIRVMLAYGLLLTTPAIPDIICRTIGKASQAGQLLGQELRGGYQAGQQQLRGYGQGLQGVGTGLAGQVQYSIDSQGVLKPYMTGSPGLAQIIGSIRGKGKSKTIGLTRDTTAGET